MPSSVSIDRNPSFLSGAFVVNHLQAYHTNSRMALNNDKAKWIRVNESNAAIVSDWTIPGTFIYRVIVWHNKNKTKLGYLYSQYKYQKPLRYLQHSQISNNDHPAAFSPEFSPTYFKTLSLSLKSSLSAMLLNSTVHHVVMNSVTCTESDLHYYFISMLLLLIGIVHFYKLQLAET